MRQHTPPLPAALKASLLALVLLAALAAPLAAAAPTKWTILIYMLADNDLECYGILNLQQLVQGMGIEPPGCMSTECGGTCAAGLVKTGSTLCLSVSAAAAAVAGGCWKQAGAARLARPRGGAGQGRSGLG